MQISQAVDLLTAPWVAIALTVALLGLPGLWLLFRQHKHWRRAEQARDSAGYARAALEAALETAPEGYFAWFTRPANASDDGLPAAWRGGGTEAIGVCSRRLAVLLDLFHGLEANFDQVIEGFDKTSQDTLRAAVNTLRAHGDGFQIALTHATTRRRIQARGVRAADNDGRTMADVVWMGDVTEGVAAVDTLTQETSVLRRERDLLKAAMDGVAEPIWVRDDDLSLIYCNASYVRAVDGKDAGDVVARGRELAPRVSVREARALAAAARASSETRRAPFHMVIDGSRRLMEVTEAAVTIQSEARPERGDAPLFSDGSGRLTAGIAYDITRQEELEVRLKREAAAHADVLERLGTAIAVFGPTRAWRSSTPPSPSCGASTVPGCTKGRPTPPCSMPCAPNAVCPKSRTSRRTKRRKSHASIPSSSPSRICCICPTAARCAAWSRRIRWAAC